MRTPLPAPRRSRQPGATINTIATPSRTGSPRQASVRHLPVNLFASVMGISGLATAWRQATHQFGASPLVEGAIGAVAVGIFILLCLAYGAKVLRHPDAVQGEFRHPIAGNFFGTVTIAILLISSVVAPVSALASQVLWTIGAATTIALSFTIVSRLLRGKVDAGHAVPAWLIPGVATLDITVAGGTMPMAWAHELNLFAMAVGTTMALLFFTMIMSRLIHHHEKLASEMVPSMMILIAPFEVGFLAYTHFFQRVDTFAAMLFYFGLFVFLALVFKIFRRSIPFAAGWWALSFPIAALCNAALRYAEHVHNAALTALAVALLAFLSVLIAVLTYRTLHLLASGRLLAPK
ncbi:SLAC1 anion channel family protein [Variovorax paradoxus]|jgi:tellurite resistance protein